MAFLLKIRRGRTRGEALGWRIDLRVVLLPPAASAGVFLTVQFPTRE